MDLFTFLHQTKLNSYAADGGKSVPVQENGSKEIIVREGPYVYRDRYFGSDPFVGEEIVFCDGHAVWAMNYYGKVTVAGIDSQTVYGFLQMALRNADPDRPLRGPARLSEGSWEYRAQSSGDLDGFEGEETIAFEGWVVYRLVFHGGKLG